MSVDEVANNNFPEFKGIQVGDQVVSADKQTAPADDADDARLLALATERMKRYDPSQTRSFSEIKEKYGITDDDLADIDAVIE